MLKGFRKISCRLTEFSDLLLHLIADRFRIHRHHHTPRQPRQRHQRAS